MKLFLDTEFNGFGGQLISLALVPEDLKVAAFYSEVEMREQLDPWVRDNVAPHLIMVPTTYWEFQIKLSDYLSKFSSIEIICDWPDDVRYFCEALIVGPGESFVTWQQIDFHIDRTLRYDSAVPHNALYDARALRASWLKSKPL